MHPVGKHPSPLPQSSSGLQIGCSHSAPVKPSLQAHWFGPLHSWFLTLLFVQFTLSQLYIVHTGEWALAFIQPQCNVEGRMVLHNVKGAPLQLPSATAAQSLCLWHASRASSKSLNLLYPSSLSSQYNVLARSHPHDDPAGRMVLHNVKGAPLQLASATAAQSLSLWHASRASSKSLNLVYPSRFLSQYIFGVPALPCTRPFHPLSQEHFPVDSWHFPCPLQLKPRSELLKSGDLRQS